MKEDIEVYFNHNPKEAVVYETKDGTFFPAKNKQDAISHQRSLNASVEAIKEVRNPELSTKDEEQETSANDFINTQLEDAKKELADKEQLLTKATDDLEAAEKTLEAKQESIAKLDEVIQEKGEELKKIETDIESKTKTLKELEAKASEPKKPKSIK